MISQSVQSRRRSITEEPFPGWSVWVFLGGAAVNMLVYGTLGVMATAWVWRASQRMLQP